MRPIVTDGVAWSVCQCVFHDRELFKTAEPIEMPFGCGLGWDQLPKEPCMGVQIPHANGQF